MNDRLLLLLLVIIFQMLGASGIQAQQGPSAPSCLGCPQYERPPYPHSGWWHNPQQPGKGMTIDIQNGVLAANFYGYRDDGSAAWFQISGRLVNSELESVYWELDSDLLEFANGQDFNGDYVEPELIGSAGSIHIEFHARNLLSYQVDGGEPQSMTQFIFGGTTFPSFEPQSNYLMPSHEEAALLYGFNIGEISDALVPWLIVHRRDLNGEALLRWGFGGLHTRILWGNTSADSDSAIGIQYSILFGDYDFAPHVSMGGLLSCGKGSDLVFLFPDLRTSAQNNTPICVVAMNVGNPEGVSRLYYLPIADFSDRHFTGISEDGWVIEGFRLLHD